MSSSGYLIPRSKDPAQEKLWVETWKRIDRFLPDLRKELDLDLKDTEKPLLSPTSAPVEERKEEESTQATVAPVS
jgi:brefeldin A-resistance guanine nucleotide exchange factor 1